NDFTWKDFQTRNNSELVAIYGNFVNRVLVLMQKYYNGTVPQPAAFSETDQELLQLLADAPANIGQSLDQYRFREALSAYIQLARSGNKYLADEEPWKLVKTDPERTQTILYVATQVCAALAQLGEPFLPFTSARLRSFLHLDLMSWEACKRKEFIPAGSQLEKGELLFQKIEDDKVQTQLDKLKRNPTQNNPSQKLIPLKEEITFDDFTKLDIRTGTILAAEPVPKTDKLLKLTVDIGVETRTIVSGIAEHFKPEDIIGQQVSVLANLAPKKLRGVESKGMVLMAENAEGKLVFAQPSDTMENGSVVR
ncbi:MAG TPA: methionine--tRNA ligase subunit beta, partial [Cryomorphaceae bacterium]|nr:methionine--tRNA ligase subunit beta [Cryomorphaceae bacterium]